MTYEVVQLNAKTIVGLQARSSNTDPHMGEIIGDLWERLYAGLYETIPGKVNGKSIGLYTGYAGDSYDVVVGCEAVPGEALPAGVVQAVIPAGRYAKFVVHGDVQKDVAAFWESCGPWICRAPSRRILRNTSPAAICSTRKSTSILP